MQPSDSSAVPRKRLRSLVLRLTITAFILPVLLYCSLRVYTAYVAHRSITLLDEATRIPIGASEGSILPLVARYGGIKWTPPPPPPVDDCVDKAACEEQNAHRPDYQYGIALSPFNVLPSNPAQAQTGRIHHLLTVLMIRTPSEWRDPFSLRDIWTDVEISIRAGRVVAVEGELFVEGRNRWLGNTWRLSEEIRDLNMPEKAYAIDGTFLTFPGNGGAGTVHNLTPRATPEQFASAHTFNTRCMNGIVPCRCLSDLTPLAFQYIGKHPDVGATIMTDDCPYPSNAR